MPLAGIADLAAALPFCSRRSLVAFAHVPGVLPLITNGVSLLLQVLVLLPVWVYHACLVLFAAAMIPALIDERARTPGSGAAMAE